MNTQPCNNNNNRIENYALVKWLKIKRYEISHQFEKKADTYFDLAFFFCFLILFLKIHEFTINWWEKIQILFYHLFLSYSVFIKLQGRKQSIFAKALEEQINQESTPLRDSGAVGPPQIVDMYDSYSAVEGLKFYFNIYLLVENPILSTNNWKYIHIIQVKLVTSVPKFKVHRHQHLNSTTKV